MSSKQILISNDDGYRSEGIQALFHGLKNAGHRVVMCAPDRERSTMSHALTLHKPLRIYRHAEDQYHLSGTPADCIQVGMRYPYEPAFKPELVIAGINRGSNLGTDVHYSGTVSCAREAALSNVPAIAVSLVLQHLSTPQEKKREREPHYDTAARVVVELIPKLGQYFKLRRHLLNINVPNVPWSELKGVRLACLGDRNYEGDLVLREDPRGRPYLWIGGQYRGYASQAGSDNDFIAENFAAVTPVNLDPTDYNLIDKMKSWGIE